MRSTLEQSFDFGEFFRIIQLAEVFGLLSQLFALNRRVSLVGHNLGGGRVELSCEVRQVEI